MKIALDFDQTFTLSPRFWLGFLRDAIARGHEVRIVTARDEHNDGINWALFGGRYGTHFPYVAPCRVIWCDGRTKRTVCKELGWEPDIWIDDNPAGIIFPTSFKDRESLAAWRGTDEYRGSTKPVTGESRGFDERDALDAKQHPKPALRRAADRR